MPRSMCSWIPKPKQPVSLKFLLSSSYSLTFSPLSRSCIAFSPLTVTQQAIFSLRLIPKERTVYLAEESENHKMLDKRRNFSVLGSREEKTNNKKRQIYPQRTLVTGHSAAPGPKSMEANHGLTDMLKFKGTHRTIKQLTA